MFDVYIGDVNLTLILIIFSILLILPCQLLLCFKAKKVLVRLIPSFIFIFSSALFIILSRTAMDWSALFYIICAVYSGILLLMCVVGWIIFGIIKAVKGIKKCPMQTIFLKTEAIRRKS